MSKKWTITWLTFVFLLFLGLAIYCFYKDHPALLISSELAIPLLYAITIWVILKTLRPVKLIGMSMNQLKEGDFSITLRSTGNKDADSLIDVYNSMITRLREERLSVREKNQFLDLLIESSPLGIVMMDLDNRIVDINSAALQCLRIPDGKFSGRYLSELDSALAKETARIEFNEKQSIVLADGQKFLCRKLYFMDHGFRHPFYIIEEFTEEIRRAEKEAYGKLIRMMAHEINNTIGSVNSIMSSVQSNPASLINDERDETIRMLGIAIQRNYQMNRFMQNFSNFVKLPKPEREKMNLNESIRAVVDSFGTEMNGKKIYPEIDLHDSEPAIVADRSQMEQVFSNIIKNSIESVGVNGHLKISGGINPVTVSFEDDGTGLSKEVTEKIFTPFFSTKAGGQGIGLTLIQEILSNHDFTFSLRNRDPKGAEFIINC